QDVEIIEGLPVFAELDQGGRPSEPGRPVVPLGLQMLFGGLQAGLGALSGGPGWLRTADRHVAQVIIALKCLVLLKRSFGEVPIQSPRGVSLRGSVPDATGSRPSLGAAQDLQGPRDQLGLLEPILDRLVVGGGRPDVHPSIVIGTRSLDPEGGEAVGGLAISTG